MRYLLIILSLLSLTGCYIDSDNKVHQVFCIASFSSIPYTNYSKGPVFTITFKGDTYLTFTDENNKVVVLNKNYQCRIN